MREMKVSAYSSFEEENRAEHARLAKMIPAQRLAEMAVLQERVWGARWTSEPIVKVAHWETVPWYKPE